MTEVLSLVVYSAVSSRCQQAETFTTLLAHGGEVAGGQQTSRTPFRNVTIIVTIIVDAIMY